MMKKISCLLSVLLWALPVDSKTLEQNLNVNIGIFDAARATMQYEIDENSYAFSSAVKTAGLFGKLYYFDALYSTKGKIVDNKFITQSYQYTSKSSSHTRTKELVFDKLGTLYERKSSKDNKEKIVKIDVKNQTFDFNDLQSVFAYLTKQLKENRFCDTKQTVFDGKKTYQISITDEGLTDFADKDVAYKGKALKCSMIIKRTDTQDDDLLFNTTAEREIYFWIAKHEQMPFVAKIEIDSTPLGKLKAYTTDVNIKE